MSETDRRGFLCSGLVGATGIAAAGALAAFPTVSIASYSPEFLQWYTLAEQTPAAHEAFDAWERAHPNATSKEYEGSPLSRLTAALKLIEEAIFAKPVNSWTDVAELGMIALYWSEKNLLPDDHGDDPLEFGLGRDPDLKSEYWGERPRAYLIQAVATLAMGGVHA